MRAPPEKKRLLTTAREVAVGVRIQRKKQFLIDVIAGRTTPDSFDNLRSLTLVRDWDEPTIGILKIRNPNQFTTTHPTYGKDVQEILVLTYELNKVFPRNRKRQHKPAKLQIEEHKDRGQALDDENQNLTTLWSQAQLQAEELERTIRQLTIDVSYFRKLCAEQTAQIASLRSELSGKPFRTIE